MSFTVKTLTTGELEIVTTFQSPEVAIEAFSDATHYHILGAFVPQVSASARLEVLGLASKAGVILRAWIFDTVEAALLTGSLVTISQVADTIRRGQAVELRAGRTYQIFVSVEAPAVGPDAFGVFRYVTPAE